MASHIADLTGQVAIAEFKTNQSICQMIGLCGHLTLHKSKAAMVTIPDNKTEKSLLALVMQKD